ncbi:hypothetical protein ORIO_20440 (plasmid) [Cereibacter azotoformans]|uniref:hypothetical protein n=1 Tax=Cereibacter azotoformans TaxID=43057 RepID=UPI001EEB71F1|nr:hypothetical protein [Cereibacter azotoformans]ULB12172.1 hypothetical protein ORIO_20440 [Cereibacter azotoformans]
MIIRARLSRAPASYGRFWVTRRDHVARLSVTDARGAVVEEPAHLDPRLWESAGTYGAG